jgi:hypothetical protein
MTERGSTPFWTPQQPHKTAEHSPAFLFSQSDDGKVNFNDAIVLDQNWEQLSKNNWLLPELADLDTFLKKRQELTNKLKGN